MGILHRPEQSRRMLSFLEKKRVGCRLGHCASALAPPPVVAVVACHRVRDRATATRGVEPRRHRRHRGREEARSRRYLGSRRRRRRSELNRAAAVRWRGERGGRLLPLRVTRSRHRRSGSRRRRRYRCPQGRCRRSGS
jgi:hypothetical protein